MILEVSIVKFDVRLKSKFLNELLKQINELTKLRLTIKSWRPTEEKHSIND
jgi:hypothetical protein